LEINGSRGGGGESRNAWERKRTYGVQNGWTKRENQTERISKSTNVGERGILTGVEGKKVNCWEFHGDLT